jgi:hypothetical protein
MTLSPPNGRGRPPGRPDSRPTTIAARPLAREAKLVLSVQQSGVNQPVLTAWYVADLPGHIAAHIAVNPVTGDWQWTGRIDKDGYGRIGDQPAHRVVWKLLAGPIPDGLVLDHRDDWGCESRACVFPGHLLPVTSAVNVLRGRSFSAINTRKTKCDHGHPYNEENTYRWHGRRDCRACIRDRVKRYKQRHATRSDFRAAA